MATAPQMMMSSGPEHFVKGDGSRKQLRRDRIVAVAVLVFFAALFALLMWLAGMGETPDGMQYDYWMMP